MRGCSGFASGVSALGLAGAPSLTRGFPARWSHHKRKLPPISSHICLLSPLGARMWHLRHGFVAEFGRLPIPGKDFTRRSCEIGASHPQLPARACESARRRAYEARSRAGCATLRRRGREAEGGGLLNRYRVVKPYRGFESLRLRHYFAHGSFALLNASAGAPFRRSRSRAPVGVFELSSELSAIFSIFAARPPRNRRQIRAISASMQQRPP